MTLDRCFALGSLAYARFNTQQTAATIISLSVLLAFALHSWGVVIERSITPVPRNNTTLYTWTINHDQVEGRGGEEWADEARARVQERVLLIRDLTNSVVRIAYPALLSGLTVLALYLFVLRTRKRKSSLHISRTRKVLTPNSSFESRPFLVSQVRRRERSLFLLMIAVVILAFVQVLPGPH